MVNQFKQQLNGVMQRELNRGEFLKLIGVASLSLIGAVGFLKNLHEFMPRDSNAKNRSGGYGRSAYGR